MNELGSFSYLALYSKDATKLVDGNGDTYNWKWLAPTNLQARKSPVLFLEVVTAYVDDSDGTQPGRPRMIRLKIPSENYYSNETTEPYIAYPIIAQMIRDTPTGHWITQPNASPIIQVPSNLQTLEMDLLDPNGSVIAVDSTFVETFNIILKLHHPAHNEVRDNTLMSYAQSQVGNPPFNRL